MVAVEAKGADASVVAHTSSLKRVKKENLFFASIYFLVKKMTDETLLCSCDNETSKKMGQENERLPLSVS